MFRKAICAMLLISGAACMMPPSMPMPQPVRSGWTVQKQQAVDLIKGLETGDPKAFAAVNPNKYIEHDLDGHDGLAGLLGLQKAVANTTKVQILRVFQDGDYVFVHSNYSSFAGTPMMAFDVLRFENGQIVEHWDNRQVTSTRPNPAGRTMAEGPTQSWDYYGTEYNKAMVSYYARTLVTPPWDYRYLSYSLIQHNPLLGDGASGLYYGWAGLAANGTAVKYTSIFKVLGEGEFVLVMAQGTFGPNPVAFYDLCRLEYGMIVEHWDTMQTIPPRSQWKNNNGKF